VSGAHRHGKVGPNAIIQTAAALEAQGGRRLAETAFGEAGMTAMLDDPPQEMVDEALVARLNRAVLAVMPQDEALAVLAEAGERTGRYVLENRIPAPIRMFLRLLPARLAAPLLLSAIRRNGWTFAGSGRVSVRPGRRACIEIAANPIPLPGGVWHAGAFGHLFRALVSPRARVSHAGGAAEERFTIEW